MLNYKLLILMLIFKDIIKIISQNYDSSIYIYIVIHICNYIITYFNYYNICINIKIVFRWTS